MREIKFRAWNKQTRRMEEVKQINLFDDEMLNGRLVWYSLRHAELLQYTGLQDKNGTEIYEGDIVKDVSDELIGYIEYSDGGFVIIYDDIVQKLNADESAYLEVVGNIFENPELLGEG